MEVENKQFIKEKLSDSELRKFYEDSIKRDIADIVEIREGTKLDPNLSSEPWLTTVWKRIKENPVATYSLHYSLFMIFMAIFYSAFIPHSVFNTDGINAGALGGGSDQYTSLRHPFGTDSTGRDLLSLILAGSYTSMLVGIGSAFIFLIIGVSIGLVAGYYGGLIEEMLMRFTDFILAIPFLLIAILGIRLVQKSGTSIYSSIPIPVIVLFILGIFGWAGTSRLVDATTKQVLSEEYIAAARTLGASDRRIIFKHILPNILAPIIVVGTLGIATGILSEAGLTFLGFGSPADSVSWGTVLTQGVDNIKLHPQQTLIAGFAVFFIAMAVNLLGDALRDALDPRLKR